MTVRVRRVDYYYAMVRDRPGEGHRLLSQLAEQGVDLLAFNAIPMGGEKTQLVLFPADAARLVSVAEKTGLALTGPQHALLVQGDDRLGAIADIHGRLADAGLNVYSSQGVTDGRGGFGYLIHVRPEDFDRAASVLES